MNITTPRGSATSIPASRDDTSVTSPTHWPEAGRSTPAGTHRRTTARMDEKNLPERAREMLRGLLTCSSRRVGPDELVDSLARDICADGPRVRRQVLLTPLFLRLPVNCQRSTPALRRHYETGAMAGDRVVAHMENSRAMRMPVEAERSRGPPWPTRETGRSVTSLSTRGRTTMANRTTTKRARTSAASVP